MHTFRCYDVSLCEQRQPVVWGQDSSANAHCLVQELQGVCMTHWRCMTIVECTCIHINCWISEPARQVFVLNECIGIAVIVADARQQPSCAHAQLRCAIHACVGTACQARSGGPARFLTEQADHSYTIHSLPFATRKNTSILP